jgi:hypothetical protein
MLLAPAANAARQSGRGAVSTLAAVVWRTMAVATAAVAATAASVHPTAHASLHQ